MPFAHFVYDNGRLPRFLGKAEVFAVPVVGRILRSAGQIPVYRKSADASKAFSAAVAAVDAGRVRRRLPRGHDHPRPGPVADGRQDRRRPDRADDRAAR